MSDIGEIIGRITRLIEEDGPYLLPNGSLDIAKINALGVPDGQVPVVTDGRLQFDDDILHEEDLDEEIAARELADIELEQGLEDLRDEFEGHTHPDLATDAEMSAEAATRASADTELDGRLDAIEADYTTSVELAAAVSAVTVDVDAEIIRLEQSTDDLRDEFEGHVHPEIQAEVLTREAADAALDVRLDVLEAVDYATQAELDAHTGDASAAHAASAISYAGGTGMSATDVEAAIDELANEKANSTSVDAEILLSRVAEVTLSSDLQDLRDDYESEINLRLPLSGGTLHGSVSVQSTNGLEAELNEDGLYLGTVSGGPDWALTRESTDVASIGSNDLRRTTDGTNSDSLIRLAQLTAEVAALTAADSTLEAMIDSAGSNLSSELQDLRDEYESEIDLRLPLSGGTLSGPVEVEGPNALTAELNEDGLYLGTTAGGPDWVLLRESADVASIGSNDLRRTTDASNADSVPRLSQMEAADDLKLDLAGGTMTGDLTITSTGDATLTIEADSDNVTETDNPTLWLKQDGGIINAKLGIDSSNRAFIRTTNDGVAGPFLWRTPDEVSFYKVWDSNSDGAGSGLDADLLDGQEGSYYAVETETDLSNVLLTQAIEDLRDDTEASLATRFDKAGGNITGPVSMSGLGVDGVLTFDDGTAKTDVGTYGLSLRNARGSTYQSVFLGHPSGAASDPVLRFSTDGATGTMWTMSHTADQVVELSAGSDLRRNDDATHADGLVRLSQVPTAAQIVNLSSDIQDLRDDYKDEIDLRLPMWGGTLYGDLVIQGDTDRSDLTESGLFLGTVAGGPDWSLTRESADVATIGFNDLRRSDDASHADSMPRLSQLTAVDDRVDVIEADYITSLDHIHDLAVPTAATPMGGYGFTGLGNLVWSTDITLSRTGANTLDLTTSSGGRITLNGKRAFDFGDSWLRINESSAFTGGIYTGTSIVRSDASLRVGSSGVDLSSPSGTDGVFKTGIATVLTQIMRLVHASAWTTPIANTPFLQLGDATNQSPMITGASGVVLDQLGITTEGLVLANTTFGNVVEPTSLLSLQGGGAANGITFGHDGANPVTLYRSGADTLATDDALTAAIDVYARFGTTPQVKIGNDGSGRAAVIFGDLGDTNLYRGAADSLRTDDDFVVNGATKRFQKLSTSMNDSDFLISLYNETDAATRFGIRTSGKIEWGATGAAIDTNLYRSAANTLSTDDDVYLGTSTARLRLGGWETDPSSWAGIRSAALAAGDMGILFHTGGRIIINNPTGTYTHMRVNNVDQAVFHSGGMVVPSGKLLSFSSSATPTSDGDASLKRYAAGSLGIASTGDASFIIEADTDNTTETDNPTLVLRQDGALVESRIGLFGDTPVANAMYIQPAAVGGNADLYHLDSAGTTANKFWHAGNDGAGSLLDSDQLDGQHGTYYEQLIEDLREEFEGHSHDIASPSARLVHSTTQNVTSGGWVELTFDTETYDLSGLHSSGSPTRLVAPRSGVYHVWGSVSFPVNSTGARFARIVANGATEVGYAGPLLGHATYNVRVPVVCETYLAESEYVTLQAFQDSGSTLAINANSWFGMSFIRP